MLFNLFKRADSGAHVAVAAAGSSPVESSADTPASEAAAVAAAEGASDAKPADTAASPAAAAEPGPDGAVPLEPSPPDRTTASAPPTAAVTKPDRPGHSAPEPAAPEPAASAATAPAATAAITSTPATPTAAGAANVASVALAVVVPLDRRASAERRTDPTTLGAASSADLVPLDGLIGQDEPVRALRIAAASRARGAHILITAPADGDAAAAVAEILAGASDAHLHPRADWVYLHDFDHPDRPRALRLPAGDARRLDQAIVDALAELAATLPACLAADDHAAALRAVDAETVDAYDDRLLALVAKAEAQNVAILRTPSGYAAAPMLDGKVVKPDVFARLPEDMRKDVESRVTRVQQALAAHLGERPAIEKERRHRRAALEAAAAERCIAAAFAPARGAFDTAPDVMAHIGACERALRAEHADLAATALTLGEAPSRARLLAVPAFRRAMVRQLSTLGDANPSSAPARPLSDVDAGCLCGTVSHPTVGAAQADHHAISAGALHAAEGGTLLLDARALLRAPDGLAALVGAMSTGEIAPARVGGIAAQAVPLATRIVVLGDAATVAALGTLAPGLPDLFKVAITLPEAVHRDTAHETALVRRLAAAVRDERLPPFDAEALARVIDEAARLAGQPDRLTTRTGLLVDLMHEAAVVARWEAREIVTAADVGSALEARRARGAQPGPPSHTATHPTATAAAATASRSRTADAGASS